MDLLRKDNIPQYDLLRVTAMLLVVLGHSILIPTDTFDSYPGSPISLPDCKVAFYSKFINYWIYAFHMPLFFALSGALLYKTFAERGREKFRAFFEKKWKRLMLPCIAVSFCYTIPIIVFFWHNYSSMDLNIEIIIYKFFFQDGNSHLWFLFVLFWITLCAFVLFPLSIKNGWCVICILLGTLILNLMIGCFYNGKFNPLFIYTTFTYLFWFYVGYYFERYRNTIDRWLSHNKWIIIPSLGLFILYPWIDLRWCPFLDRYAHSFLIALLGSRPILQAFAGMWLVYYSCYLVANSRLLNFLKTNKIYVYLRKYCYELYLYSSPLNYIVILAMVLFTGEYYTTNTGFMALIIARFFLTILGSCLIIGFVRIAKNT